MGAAFRAREFRRSATLCWRGEGFETDNLARQPAGMRRAAALPHGSTNTRRNRRCRNTVFWQNEPEIAVWQNEPEVARTRRLIVIEEF